MRTGDLTLSPLLAVLWATLYGMAGGFHNVNRPIGDYLMTIAQVASELREMADRFQQLSIDVTKPLIEPVNLAEAVNKLRDAVGPDDHFSIGFELGSYGYRDKTEEVEWKVYHDGAFFKAPALTDAVNQVLAKVRSKNTEGDPVEETEQALQPSVPY